MFIIELTYTAELARIDAHMSEHMEFLRKYYEDGTFLVSGRKVPREGGVIVASCESREQAEAIAREDPFYQHGLSDFRVIQFRASQCAPDFPKRMQER